MDEIPKTHTELSSLYGNALRNMQFYITTVVNNNNMAIVQNAVFISGFITITDNATWVKSDTIADNFIKVQEFESINTTLMYAFSLLQTMFPLLLPSWQRMRIVSINIYASV